jgi:assimilatory nitrate reductase catalytic subunit
MAWLPQEDALRARAHLRHAMSLFPFASCVPFGRERSGVLFRAAAYEVPPAASLAEVESALALDSAEALRYEDKRRGQRRVVRLARSGAESRIDAFLLAGDTSAQAWMKTFLEDELPAQAYGRLLLAPGAKPPAALRSRGRAICTCFNVTNSQVASCLAECDGNADERLAHLQSQLKCGTHCGSCVPELKRLVRLAQPQLSI